MLTRKVGGKKGAHTKEKAQGQIIMDRNIQTPNVNQDRGHKKILYELTGKCAFNASFRLRRHSNCVLLGEVGKNVIENGDNDIMVDWQVGISCPGWKDSIFEGTKPRKEWFEVRSHLLDN